MSHYQIEKLYFNCDRQIEQPAGNKSAHPFKERTRPAIATVYFCCPNFLTAYLKVALRT